MATPAQLLTAIATEIETITSATRLTSDYRDDLEFIAVGATRYQLKGGPSGVDADSNTSRARMVVEINLIHRLANPDAERTYTEGDFQTHLKALTLPATWRALAEVFSLITLPFYEVERKRNAFEATITMEVALSE